MQPHQITPDMTVSPQITPEDVAEIAAQGFKTLIINRPDEESGPGLDSKAIGAAAESAGIKWYYLPYYPGQLTPELAAEFVKIYDECAKPVFGYCRSGTRSSHLWAFSQAGKMSIPDILHHGAQAGYDLSGLAEYLEGFE